jgi:hypothetical protein
MLALQNKPEEDQPVVDIAKTYWEYLGVYWQDMIGYGLAALAIALLWSAVVGRRRTTEPWKGERWLRLAVVLGLIGLGLWRAYQNATCFDDAYISLRYAENFVAGKGLVWNEGEYVEGYTNFLWVMLVSLFLWLTPAEAPLIAVLGSMLAFAINLWVVWRISLKIAPPFHRHAFAFPIAVGLLAVQSSFTDYGTTGLETAFASLMVNLGVFALVWEDSPRATFWAGFCWIMATLTRPDHALFYAVGSAVVFGVWVLPSWRARKRGLRAIWREGLLPMFSYAAPFLIWLAYSAWKLRYYGELLPNTYYAKSAYDTYYSQGMVYAASFHLASHLWVVILALILLWPWRMPSNIAGRRYMAFAVPAILAYEWYVVRVGGDFMYGRFYVSLIPLMLLAGEQVVHEFSLSRAARAQALERLASRRSAAERSAAEGDAELPPPTRAPLRAGALVMIFLMAASAVGVQMIAPRKTRWKLTDETSYYPIAEWSPMVIDHANYRVGIALGRIQAGLEGKHVSEPIIATGAIGLLGYYSHMPLIDRLGLTDATVAHQEIKKRGRPGHEKWAEPDYIRERGVHFIRGGGYPSWFRTYGTIRWGSAVGGRRWYILKYDRELMNAIREVDPDVYFYDFEVYIDRYIARLPTTPVKKVRKEWDWFKKYYFDHNNDPERRAAFTTYFQWIREGRKPGDLLKEGRWDEYKKRGTQATLRERELRQARSDAQRAAKGLPIRTPSSSKTLEKPTGTRIERPAALVDEDELVAPAEDDAAEDDEAPAEDDAAEDDAA